MEKFAVGLLIGGLGGALLATNNLKMRTLIKKGQDEIKARLDELMDEKLQEMETSSVAEHAKETGEKMKDVAETVKDGVAETAKKVKEDAQELAADVKAIAKGKRKAAK